MAEESGFDTYQRLLKAYRRAVIRWANGSTGDGYTPDSGPMVEAERDLDAFVKAILAPSQPSAEQGFVRPALTPIVVDAFLRARRGGNNMLSPLPDAEPFVTAILATLERDFGIRFGIFPSQPSPQFSALATVVNGRCPNCGTPDPLSPPRAPDTAPDALRDRWRDEVARQITLLANILDPSWDKEGGEYLNVTNCIDGIASAGLSMLAPAKPEPPEFYPVREWFTASDTTLMVCPFCHMVAMEGEVECTRCGQHPTEPQGQITARDALRGVVTEVSNRPPNAFVTVMFDGWVETSMVGKGAALTPASTSGTGRCEKVDTLGNRCGRPARHKGFHNAASTQGTGEPGALQEGLIDFTCPRCRRGEPCEVNDALNSGPVGFFGEPSADDHAACAYPCPECDPEPSADTPTASEQRWTADQLRWSHALEPSAAPREPDKLTQRIRFRRLLRALENAIAEREGRTSTSWSIQQAARHEVDMERVRPARDKLDAFFESLIGTPSPSTRPAEPDALTLLNEAWMLVVDCIEGDNHDDYAHEVVRKIYDLIGSRVYGN